MGWAARISRHELGERAGLDQAFISRLETGTAEGTLAQMVAIARALTESLRISEAEWRALASLELPAPVAKEGYVGVLMAVRAAGGGR